LTEAQLSATANEKDPNATHPLRHCLHLYKELDDDLRAFESARQTKVQQSHDRSRESSGTSLPKVSPRGFQSSPRTARPALQVSGKTVIAEPEQDHNDPNQHRATREKRENLSGVGNWLDCRAFAANENTFLGIARQKKKRECKAYSMTSLSGGERFFLRRCKDTLLTRYGNLQAAFKRLDMNHSQGLSMIEFIASSSSILKEHEARVLYMYLDQDHDQTVTMNELCSLLEVC